MTGLRLLCPVLLLHAGCAPDSADVRGHTSDAGIRVELVAELGDDDLPGSIGSPTARVSQLHDGRFLASSHPDRGEIIVFDSSGAFLQRFGRLGQGPGEFQAPAFFWTVGESDTLVVADPMAARLTELLVGGAEVYRTRSFPFTTLMGVLPVGDGTLLVNAPRFTPEAIGLPLHWVGRDGTILDSFGSGRPLVHSDNAVSLLQRGMGRSREGGLWVSHSVDYTIERWSLEGELIESFSPGFAWFDAEAGRRGVPRSPDDDPPRVGLQGIWEDDAGRVWVVARIPADGWRERFRPAEGPDPRFDWEVVGYGDVLWQSRIQVWWPETWELLADTVVSPMWFDVLGEGYGFSRHLDGPGIPRLRVWRAEWASSP